jgi:predicted nucleic acid-binding protein
VATTYIDTSALVKRYVAEVGSAWVRRMVARPVQHVIYTAALTEVEVRSALQRLVRESRLDTAQAQRLTQRVLQHFTRRYQLIRITRPVVAEAGRLVEGYPLRAYDAVQLACALTVRRSMHRRGMLPPLFVTADTTLLAAARAEGFLVDNPLQHP